MSSTLRLATAAKPRFEYLPVGLFGSVMGLTGLSVACRLARTRYGGPEWPSTLFALLAVTAFATLAAAYAAKWVTAPETVRNEFRHPVASSLFGTIFISLVLLPIVIAPVSHRVALVLWAVGTVGMFGFAWYMVSRWMSDRQQVAHATPTWIVPVVGLLDVPLALPSLGLPGLQGIAVFSLAVGLFFTAPLFTMILSRILFEPPMPDALRPSLMILVAPFAVGYSTYGAAGGNDDVFAEALYSVTLFILTVLLGQMRHLFRCCPFRVAWWAVSFPLAASAIAALRFAASNPGPFTDTVAIVMLALATVTTLGLLGRTLLGVVRGELRTLSA